METACVSAERRSDRIDWSVVIDAELDRLEALAIWVETCPSEGAFRAALALDDWEWLEAMGERLGIVLAVGKVVV